MEDDVSPEVIAKAGSGDMTAFEEIYRKTSGFVFNVAARITGKNADAEDVVQEVFVKMHSALKQFAGRSSCRTWLYRITVNTAISRFRKNAQEAVKMKKYEDHLETQPAPDMPDRELQNEQRNSVAALLAKLDPDQRACIVLRDIEDRPYLEISEILHIPLNTVRSRLSRARETLLKHAGRR